MIKLNWSEKIASYFTGSGLLYIVSDKHGLLSQTVMQDTLSQQNCLLYFYKDPVIFREHYELNFRHIDRTKRSSLLLVVSDKLFNQIPYDIYVQAIHIKLSFNELFPDLDYFVLNQCPIWMYEQIFIAQNLIGKKLSGPDTTDFLLNHVCGIDTSRIYNLTDLLRAALFYYDKYDEILPIFLYEHLERIITTSPKQISTDIVKVFQSKENLIYFFNEKWRKYIECFIQQAKKQVAESHEFYNHSIFQDFVIQQYIEKYIYPIEVPNNIRFEQWMLPGVIIAEEKLCVEHSPFKETYSKFERNDWLQFANDIGQIQYKILKNSNYQEHFQSDLEKANTAFKKWFLESFHQLQSLPVVPKPKLVHHIPHYLARQSNEKIALIVLDGMSFTQWHTIKSYLSKQAWKFEEDALFAWIPSVTSVSRQALFSGKEPRFFADSIMSTYKEKSLWTAFWEEQGFSPKNIAFEKSLGLALYNQKDLAYQLSPSIRIYGAVIDVIDKFMHGSAQGLQSVQSELNTWLHSNYLISFIEDLMNSDFEVYLTADHGNVECVGRGRIAQGVTVESRGERTRIYSSLNIRNYTAKEHQDTIIWDDTGLPNDYFVLLADKNNAFVPKHQKIVTHGGIHIEEVIVPFIKVSR